MVQGVDSIAQICIEYTIFKKRLNTIKVYDLFPWLLGRIWLATTVRTQYALN